MEETVESATETEALTENETADLGLDGVTRAAAEAELAEIRFLDRLVDLAEAQWFRREGAASLTGWLRRRFDLENGEAVRLARRVQLLIQLPELRSALINRQTSIGHVKLLDRYATADRRAFCTEFTEQLVGFACNLGIDDYGRVCARWADLIDGEIAPRQLPEGSLILSPTLFGQAHISGRLTADQAAPIVRALQSMIAPQAADAPVKRPYRERLADALADLAQAHLDATTGGARGVDRHHPVERGNPTEPTEHGAAPGNARARNTTTVVVDLDTLLHHNAVLWAGTDREQPALDQVRLSNAAGHALPRSVAELLMCDANIRRLVVDARGRPLDVGRRQHLATPAQRAALVHRDQGCVFPTCDRPAQYCDAHHVIPWEEGGATDLHNLVLLCRHHHRLVHGDTWDIERNQGTGDVIAWRRELRGSVAYQRDGGGGLRIIPVPPSYAHQDDFARSSP